MTDTGVHVAEVRPAALEPAPSRVLLAAFVVGLLFSVTTNAGVSTLAGALLVAATTALLLGTGVMPNRSAWAVAAAAPVFGVWLGVRDSPWLLLVDLGAAVGLLLAAASLARNGDPFDLTVPGILRRGAGAALHVLAGPAHLVTVVPGGARSRPVAAVARGLAVAAPIAVVVGALLASADPVFASLFDFVGHPVQSVGDLILVVVGAAGAAGLAGAARSSPPEPAGTPSRSALRLLGATEAVVVLGVLAALHAAFSVSQAVVIAGGARHVIETSGLTYAEYARSGFFQLLAVAVITLSVLLGVRASTRPGDDRAARWLFALSEAAIGLTVVIVLVAVRRLHLYEEAFGLTMLRLYSTVFAFWIGISFVLLGIAIARPLRRAWFVPAALAAGLALILALNVANPEALVVRRNVARAAEAERLDVWYLAGLSDDAVPALIDSLPVLEPDARAVVADSLCRRPRDDAGLWSLNASRRAASRELQALCGPVPR